MKKFVVILLTLVMIFGCMGAAYALNWTDVEADKCTEYTVSVTKYAKVAADAGTAYSKAPNATAKIGDYVYFDLVAVDVNGEPVQAEVEYHHLGNIEAVGKLYRAKVVGDKPYVKISITEKTPINELLYKGEYIYVSGETVVIGDLVFTRTSEGVVNNVMSDLNTAKMLEELAALGINIEDVYNGKICMSDDILISNFGKVCETSATAAWYVAADVMDYEMGIPKTGDMTVTGIIILALCLCGAVMFVRKGMHSKR